MATEKHKLYKKISLETISGQILDDLQNPPLPFLIECEKTIINEIKEYTQRITKLNHNNKYDTVSIVENHAGELLDRICESNRIYFENGIKTGSILLMQMLDL